MAKRSARVTVAGLAVPVRVWAQRFAFLGFVALSFALMLLSKAESTGIELAVGYVSRGCHYLLSHGGCMLNNRVRGIPVRIKMPVKRRID